VAREPFLLKSRVGAEVRKDRFASLDALLEALEARIGRVGREPARRFLNREFEPGGQVAGRFELKGPEGLRGGIDVRGDGSAEAYRGVIRKQLVEQRDGESAIDALRRALTG
jgi:hypothetical protein